MKLGSIVNITDSNSDMHRKNGEVIQIIGNEVAIMFLVRETERVTGVSCIIERFRRHQLHVMKGRKKLTMLRGL